MTPDLFSLIEEERDAANAREAEAIDFILTETFYESLKGTQEERERHLRKTGVAWDKKAQMAFHLLIVNPNMKSHELAKKLLVTPAAVKKWLNLRVLREMALSVISKKYNDPNLKNLKKLKNALVDPTHTKMVLALSRRARTFAVEYIKDFDAGKAALRAGYKSEVSGTQLMQRADILQLIHLEKEKYAANAKNHIEKLAQDFIDISQLDINEIVSVRVSPCRYCHGLHGAYQYADEQEYFDACDRAEAEGKPQPSNLGGYGYNLDAPVNEQCVRCFGAGRSKVIVKDTRKLSRAAKLAIVSIEQTRNGIKIKTAKEESFKWLQSLIADSVKKKTFGLDTAPAHDPEITELQKRKLEAEIRVLESRTFDNDDENDQVVIHDGVDLNMDAGKMPENIEDIEEASYTPVDNEQ